MLRIGSSTDKGELRERVSGVDDCNGTGTCCTEATE